MAMRGMGLGAVMVVAAGLAACAPPQPPKLDVEAQWREAISNLGMYGVDEFAAIINPPQAAILAVGSVSRQPVVAEDGSIAAGQVMSCTLSVDHRAVDGALAATWLAAFRRYMESPYLMLV